MWTEFTFADNETWKMLYSRLNPHRLKQAYHLFPEGLKMLQINEDSIPKFDEVNERLEKLTGWKAIPVEGLEDGPHFYGELARKEFPVGHFIRDRKDLNYTPAPDIFHDMYGHIPFYVDRDYAQFCEEYGKLVLRSMTDPEKLKKLERFFWFTAEFGLIETDMGRRIFGAGILSSYEECFYSLSDKPEVVPFDVQKIINQDFRIDIIQPKLFVLKNVDQLYGSLPALERAIQ